MLAVLLNLGFAGSAGVSVAVTGTASSGLTETQVRDGGETLILTLTNDTWVTAGATFNAQRQAIIDGLDSDASEATGWNAEVRDKLAVTAVARTSDTVVTITLSAAAAYDITVNETITVTVPADALTTSTSAVLGDVAFTVTADVEASATPDGGGRGAKSRRKSKYPRRISIGDRLVWVKSAEEERELLAQYVAKLEAEKARLEAKNAPKRQIAQAKVAVVRARRRIERVDDWEAAWLERLRQEDEEILLLLH